jgi:hypothetical protein
MEGEKLGINDALHDEWRKRDICLNIFGALKQCRNTRSAALSSADNAGSIYAATPAMAATPLDPSQ